VTTAGGGTWGFGLAGCGVIAETFASALVGVDGARLVAVHDVQVARAEAFAAQTGAVHARSLGELVELDGVDVVCVCVPSGLHAEVSMAAVDAGKHVVVEKPIDVNLEGRLGEPLFIQARVPWYRAQAYYDSASWRGTWALDGGGAFMNQGVHHADLLCWLFGAPEVLAAHCANLVHDIEVEDLAVALLRFPNEAVGTLVASTVSFPGFPTVLSVNGTEGSLELVDGALVAVALKGAELKGGGAELDLGDTSGLGSPEGHRAQLADIVAALGEGRPAPVGGEDGYRALKLVLDVYRRAGWRD